MVDTNGNEVADIHHLTNRTITKGGKDSDYSVDTISLSIMDTITFNDHWSLFLGLRMDDFDYDNSVGSTDPEKFSYDDTLWNGHIGVVYNFNEDVNVYLTYSTSSNINGGESDVGGSCGYGGLCGENNQQVKDSEPEDTENIELGTKWNLLDNRLLLTAAVFQITKDDVMESVGDDDYAQTGNLNTGENRVKGIEVSAVGNITEKLSVQFGATAMKAEILKSYNEEDEGKSLANFADNSAYLQLRYQLIPAFSFGGSATYSSKSFTGQPDSAEGSYELPSYTVYDLFANYNFTERLSLRLNVGNVTDKDYYLAGYRSGAFTYIGDRRNAQLTVAYEF
jgi:catecholate siderophore receptor